MWIKHIYSVWKKELGERFIYIYIYFSCPYSIQGNWTIDSKITKKERLLFIFLAQAKVVFWCFGIFDADTCPGIRIPYYPHRHPFPFALIKCKLLKNLTVLFAWVTTVPFITCRGHLYKLSCSSFIANLCVFNQILFKQVSFQRELSSWETLTKLNPCSFRSISEQLPHRQKGFRSTGHNQDKRHASDPKQRLVPRPVICGTLTVPNLSLCSGFRLSESKLLIHATDRIELPSTSLLLNCFNLFINFTIILQDAAISHSE